MEATNKELEERLRQALSEMEALKNQLKQGNMLSNSLTYPGRCTVVFGGFSQSFYYFMITCDIFISRSIRCFVV